MPCSAYTFHRALPGAPCLVVIRTTPLAASVPYSADAAGPFTTSIDSKSSGFRSLIRLGGAQRPSQTPRSEEHTSELQSHHELVCRLLLEKNNKQINSKA